MVNTTQTTSDHCHCCDTAQHLQRGCPSFLSLSFYTSTSCDCLGIASMGQVCHRKDWSPAIVGKHQHFFGIRGIGIATHHPGITRALDPVSLGSSTLVPRYGILRSWCFLAALHQPSQRPAIVLAVEAFSTNTTSAAYGLALWLAPVGAYNVFGDQGGTTFCLLIFSRRKARKRLVFFFFLVDARPTNNRLGAIFDLYQMIPLDYIPRIGHIKLRPNSFFFVDSTKKHTSFWNAWEWLEIDTVSLHHEVLAVVCKTTVATRRWNRAGKALCDGTRWDGRPRR